MNQRAECQADNDDMLSSRHYIVWTTQRRAFAGEPHYLLIQVSLALRSFSRELLQVLGCIVRSVEDVWVSHSLRRVNIKVWLGSP